MERREQVIRLWFDMWLENEDKGIKDLFAPDCLYIESWGPKYMGAEAVKRWFSDWNEHGRVLVWDIKQYIHSGRQTLVEWYFKCTMDKSGTDAFDGVSIIEWDERCRMKYLKEFGCKLPNYEPYGEKEN